MGRDPFEQGGVQTRLEPLPPVAVAALGSYSNRREAWSYAVRAVAGQFIVVFFVVFAFTAAAVVLLSPLPGGGVASAVPVATFGLMIIAVTVIAWWGMRHIDARTPHRLELSGDGIRATWSPRTAREVRIPYAAVRDLRPRHWKWISAYKQSYFLFTPATLEFDISRAEYHGMWDPSVQTDGMLYLSDENERRLRPMLASSGMPTVAEVTEVLGGGATLTEVRTDRVVFSVEEAKRVRNGGWELTGVEIRGTLRAPCLVRLRAGHRSSYPETVAQVVSARSKDDAASTDITAEMEAVLLIRPAPSGDTGDGPEGSALPDVQNGDYVVT